MSQHMLFDETPPHCQSQRMPDVVRFDGADYDHERDAARLTGQLGRIFDYMKSGAWRTLREIAAATGDPEASCSAQLRHLRKPRFGSHTIEREHRGGGLFAYRLIVNQ